MSFNNTNLPKTDLGEDWFKYSAQVHDQRIEVLHFSLASVVSLLVLIGGFVVITDKNQESDLQKLAIGLMGTVVGGSLSPLRRD